MAAVAQASPLAVLRKKSWRKQVASFKGFSKDFSWVGGLAADSTLATSFVLVNVATAVHFIAQSPGGCAVVEVAPETPLPVGRPTQDLKALEQTYQLGRKLGAQAIARWNALF